ncbi:CheY-like protein, partial [Glonium stellatum]
SNATKFTRDQPQREITVTLSYSAIRPSSDPNAISFVPPREPQVEHTVGPEWGCGEEIFIQFSVKDTGLGLSEDQCKYLFLRFSQASPKTYKRYGGSGLGLFICRGLTELQGGQIGVVSKLGHGTTFVFFVSARKWDSNCTTNNIHEMNHNTPLDISNCTQHISGGERYRYHEHISFDGLATFPPSRKLVYSSTATGDRYLNPSGSNLAADVSNPTPVPEPWPQFHILIVEDNIINQRVLAQALRAKGHVVRVVNHGGEALKMLERSTFASYPASLLPPTSRENSAPGDGSTSRDISLVPLSIVLMDLEMPVMDGLTCITHIRALQRSGGLKTHVPVIAVTANARSEQIEEAMAKGMDAVVTKPFRVHELLPKMLEVLMRCKERRDLFNRTRIDGSMDGKDGAREVGEL